MPTIDMKSILTKAKACSQTSEFQKKVEDVTDNLVTTGTIKDGKVVGASMAAGKFIEVLQNEINSLGADSGFSAGKLGVTAVSVLIKLKQGGSYKVAKNKYKIPVCFSEDLHRDSLAIDKYDGVDNIAALLNSGYKAGKTIYGIWHGHNNNKDIRSLIQRDGALFIESAIRNFMDNYSREYCVIDIEVDEVYR